MMWFLGWFICVIGFGYVLTVLDRPGIPAYTSRTRWRLVSFLLLMALWVVSTKALLWHQELVFQLRHCP